MKYKSNSTTITVDWCKTMSSLFYYFKKTIPRVLLMFPNVKKKKSKNFNVAFLLSFLLFCHTHRSQHSTVYTNVLHKKQLLWYWRCSFSGLQLCACELWQVSCSPNTVSKYTTQLLSDTSLASQYCYTKSSAVVFSVYLVGLEALLWNTWIYTTFELPVLEGE